MRSGLITTCSPVCGKNIYFLERIQPSYKTEFGETVTRLARFELNSKTTETTSQVFSNKDKEIAAFKRIFSNFRPFKTIGESFNQNGAEEMHITEKLQLKQLLEDEQRKVQEKDKKLLRLERFVKDFECQDQMASEFQAAAARTRQNYAEEMHIKDDRIKELEKRCQILEENNKRYRVITERL